MNMPYKASAPTLSSLHLLSSSITVSSHLLSLPIIFIGPSASFDSFQTIFLLSRLYINLLSKTSFPVSYLFSSSIHSLSKVSTIKMFSQTRFGLQALACLLLSLQFGQAAPTEETFQLENELQSISKELGVLSLSSRAVPNFRMSFADGIWRAQVPIDAEPTLEQLDEYSKAGFTKTMADMAKEKKTGQTNMVAALYVPKQLQFSSSQLFQKKQLFPPRKTRQAKSSNPNNPKSQHKQQFQKDQESRH